MDLKLKEVSRHKFFDGEQCVFEHSSTEVKCNMKFGIYLPPKYSDTSVDKFPILYFLSGLTCTEDNFINKSGMQRFAAKHGIVVVNPDTSPRSSDHPKEHEDWDFGSGAGFYVDATQEPWKSNYRMYSYVVSELPRVISENFNVCPENVALSGHSMGGHGALVIGMKNPSMFKCVTALSPISNPCKGPWGIKAFSNYLGSDENAWEAWDATCLARTSSVPLHILVDQGEKDRFLEKELLTSRFIDAAEKNDSLSVEYRERKGYDHFYPYISTFIEEHFDYIAKFIC